MPTYLPTHPVYGESRGTPAAWKAYFRTTGAKRIADVDAYIDTVYQFAPPAGIGAHKVIAQAVHETGGFTSQAWEGSANPAGIGVTSDAQRNWHDFQNGRNAALAHLVRLAKYLFGTVPEALAPHAALDPRGAVPATVAGAKRTIAQFGAGTASDPTWATDPAYGEKWAATLNRLEAIFASVTEAALGDLTEAVAGVVTPAVPAAKQKRIIISMGHRNTNRGGARNEINWTPACARALKAAIEARGGYAVILQEIDGRDKDPNWFPGGLTEGAVRCVELGRTLGPWDAYLSVHYNGGASPGFHAIFPDDPTRRSSDVKANNGRDVAACRNMAARVKATGTVALIGWTGDRPGVMSERETGVGSDGHRLGEFAGTAGTRDKTVRVIVEAGSIDVVREARYINDAGWVRNVYCEAIVDGLEDTIGTLGAGRVPAPAPVTYPPALPVPVLDRYMSGDVPDMPPMIPFTHEGVAYLAFPVNDRVRVSNPDGTPRRLHPDPARPEVIGPVIAANDTFDLAFRAIRRDQQTGEVAGVGRTPFGTWIDLADVAYVED